MRTTNARDQRLDTPAEPPVAVALLDQDFDRATLDALAPAARGVPAALWEAALLGPVRDMLERPGKAFRGRLVGLSWRLGGGQGAPPPQLAAALEIIHAGSMIVDDVQDGSDERRGKPAIHKLYGAPVAINAGNWMYFWPLAMIDELGLSPGVELQLRRRINRTMMDCHFGQALDLTARVGRVSQRDIQAVVSTITALKTGKLMSLAATVGCISAGAQDAVVEALGQFGQDLGVGLQMLDDLGNLAPRTPSGAALRRTTEIALDPKQHEDIRVGRATWPWAWASEILDDVTFAKLVAESQALQQRTGEEALWGAVILAEKLNAAVGAAGRAATHRHLQAALQSLTCALGPSPLLGALEQEIARLEASYG